MVSRKVSEAPFAIYYWFIQVLIVLSLVAVLVWLSTTPREPKFTITSVYVPEKGNRNSSKIQQNHTVFVIEITNPNNGKAICYLDINMKVHDGSVLVGNKSLETFCQGQKKTMTEEVVIDDDRHLQGAKVGGEEVRVTVETMLKYRILMWKTKIHRVGFEGFVRFGTEGNFTENIYLHKT